MIYSELKASIADFLNRQDLTSVIPTFIQLCEADLNRTVRHRSMLCRATTTLDAGFTALPTDFLEAKNIQLNDVSGNPVQSLQYVTMEQADEYRGGYYSTSGVPKFYTIVGDTLEVVPEPADDYTVELTYYKKLTSLSDDETSNWLLSSHPDIYLYGALMQAAPYLKNDERLPVWGQLYKATVADLNASSDKAEFSGSLLRMRASW